MFYILIKIINFKIYKHQHLVIYPYYCFYIDQNLPRTHYEVNQSNPDRTLGANTNRTISFRTQDDRATQGNEMDENESIDKSVLWKIKLISTTGSFH